jgi:hypothetical protein
VLASCGDIKLSDVAERVIALKKAISFELKCSERIVSTDEAARKVVRELLGEGLREGQRATGRQSIAQGYTEQNLGLDSLEAGFAKKGHTSR